MPETQRIYALDRGPLALPTVAQDSTIANQGQLQEVNQPVTGTGNLQFQLFDQLTDGSLVARLRTGRTGRSKTDCFRSSWTSTPRHATVVGDSSRSGSTLRRQAFARQCHKAVVSAKTKRVAELIS